MSTQKNINWGIIGCGNIADKFASDLASVPNAKLYGVASRSTEKALAFAQQHHAITHYGNYAELSTDENIDVIYIATPHTHHFEHTMMCLQRNKAVLCEKPFAMNREQVMQMMALAKSKNVFLMEALWSSFLPHYDFVVEQVKQKTLGDIKECHVDFGFLSKKPAEHRLMNKDLGGGSLLDIGIYPVFFALSLLGMPINIDARARYFDNGIDSRCEMIFTYPNKVLAYLSSSLTENTPCILRLICEHGEIQINRHFHAATSVTLTRHNKPSETVNFPRSTHGYNYEAAHVQQMLSEKRTESTIMPLEKSIQLISLLDQIRDLIGLTYA